MSLVNEIQSSHANLSHLVENSLSSIENRFEALKEEISSKIDNKVIFLSSSTRCPKKTLLSEVLSFSLRSVFLGHPILGQAFNFKNAFGSHLASSSSSLLQIESVSSGISLK